MKNYDFVSPFDGKTMKACFTKANYQIGNGLAIQMYTLDEEFGEFFPWATLTVNLPETRNCGENCAYFDANNCVGVSEFLIDNNLAKPTGNYAFSGYCQYPEFDFSNLVRDLA